MGCGASKEINAVSPSVLENHKANAAAPKSVEKTATLSNNTLSKPVIPSIAQSKKIGQSIAFEIPIDDLFEADKPAPLANRTSSGKLSQLPALSLSQQDIQAKLANSEERWKVGAQLDHLLYGDLAAEDDDGKKRRKKGMKPKLKQRKQEEDPESLKVRLLEREVAAKINREREITKLQLKLARQEEHARKVLERKKAMGGEDCEMRLSYGGEDGKGLDGTTAESSLQLKDDSGNVNGASRGSSGRSQTTDTTEVDGQQPVAAVAVNPLKMKQMKQQKGGFVSSGATAAAIAGLAPRARAN